MTKIQVKYIDTSKPFTNYVYVRTIRPPRIVGHQALKNMDFIDHDYVLDSYAYYKQVTQKRIMERYGMINLYTYIPGGLPEDEVEHNESLGINKNHTIKIIEDVPLLRIPIID